MYVKIFLMEGLSFQLKFNLIIHYIIFLFYYLIDGILFTCKSSFNYCLLLIINKDHFMYNLTHNKIFHLVDDSVIKVY